MDNIDDRITFEPLEFTHRVAVSVVMLDGNDIGQERIYYGKPFSLDESGKLIATEPEYRYVDYSKLTLHECDVIECDLAWLEQEYRNPETGEYGDGYAPCWFTLDGLIKSRIGEL